VEPFCSLSLSRQLPPLCPTAKLTSSPSTLNCILFPGGNETILGKPSDKAIDVPSSRVECAAVQTIAVSHGIVLPQNVWLARTATACVVPFSRTKIAAHRDRLSYFKAISPVRATTPSSRLHATRAPAPTSTGQRNCMQLRRLT
jgi:hypothetical protein